MDSLMKKSVHDFSFTELVHYANEAGQSSYRAQQIWEWVYGKGIDAWQDMSNVPQTFRDQLAKEILLCSLESVQETKSAEGDSTKYLFETQDHHYIETVFIASKGRRTVCLSTQIGCRHGCLFCASGKGGFVRNLSIGEILDQLLLVQKSINGRMTNVVFMGMGEPLDNYENTIQAILSINDPLRINIGQRRIALSTAGLVPAIERFMHEDLPQITLSVSLHATTDEKRKKIMPIAAQYSLKELCDVLRMNLELMKRTITLEYILIKDFNDSREDAKRLAAIAKDLHAKVNLIGYNMIDEAPYTPPTKKEALKFNEWICSFGVPSTVRYSAGSDITAACGQLRLRRQ